MTAADCLTCISDIGQKSCNIRGRLKLEVFAYFSPYRPRNGAPSARTSDEIDGRCSVSMVEVKSLIFHLDPAPRPHAKARPQEDVFFNIGASSCDRVTAFRDRTGKQANIDSSGDNRPSPRRHGNQSLVELCHILRQLSPPSSHWCILPLPTHRHGLDCPQVVLCSAACPTLVTANPHLRVYMEFRSKSPTMPQPLHLNIGRRRQTTL